MSQHTNVRGRVVPTTEKSRELLEDELALVCGGSTPDATGVGNLYGLPDVMNLLNAQGSSLSPKNNTVPNTGKNSGLPTFDNLNPLSNLTGMLGKVI